MPTQTTKQSAAKVSDDSTATRSLADVDVTEMPGQLAEQAFKIPIDILGAVSDGVVGIFDSLRGNGAKK